MASVIVLVVGPPAILALDVIVFLPADNLAAVALQQHRSHT
jgi:hypothetical protein